MKYLNNWEKYATEYSDKFIGFLPSLLFALFLLIFGLWVINIFVKYISKYFDKKDFDPTLENFAVTITNWTLKIILFVLVITKLGVETTSLVAIIGAAGLAVGLALQGTLSNFAGGVLIITLKPFKVGDFIEAQGVSGTVKETTLFYTKLITFGNQLAIIPNGQLTNDNIINYTIEGKRKDSISIGISYNSDIKLAKDTLVNLMAEQEKIFEDPAPQVVVTELADSAINLSLRFWAYNDDFWDCHWYTIEEAKIRLEAAGVGIPFPQRDVHFYNHSENTKEENKKDNKEGDKVENKEEENKEENNEEDNEEDN
jgi:small conductance mechanosensitive channel